MNISIICIGKIKERYLKLALEEYGKRLSKYCKLNIIELPDEKTPDNASTKDELLIKEKEGNKILKHLSFNSYVIALDLKGENLSSVEFAKKLSTLAVNGKSNLTFLIGGSLGMCEEVLNKCDFKLCFSKMTFPHQLFRVMLLEQIYRCFRINNGEPYHK